ncbi:MAG: stage III sporulation protein AA [Lachnospiraceae bacterium]|nr:stage III sporulation protein AA [Lachnospiraceae bacterium]
MKEHNIFSLFPGMLRETLVCAGFRQEDLQEIRIRAERPLIVRSGGRERVLERYFTGEEVGEILAYLGNYSLYAWEDEIRQGFLSLPGGHRVGLAGKTVLEDGRVHTLTEISSLNIRFAHEVRGCADTVLPYLWEGRRLCHTLFVSAPGRGKTTLLRDCIRQISDGDSSHPGMTVGLVDERSEIAGSFRGIPGNDVGLRTDVLDACPKAEGLMMLIRSMAPDVVAVDEVGSPADLAAMRHAMNCGCVLLATVHGDSMEELRRKPVLGEMVEAAFFERYVLLENRIAPGCVGQILDGQCRDVKG